MQKIRIARPSYCLEIVKSHIPYWDKNGVTFLDLDGYRVVIQNTAWGNRLII